MDYDYIDSPRYWASREIENNIISEELERYERIKED